MFKPALSSLGLPVILSILLAGSVMSADGLSPNGVWIDHTGRGAVEIKDCDGKLCGRVVWIKSTKKADGCNLQVIGDLSPGGNGAWIGGWIYDPDAATKFDVEITPISGQKLKVLGYAGTKLFGRTMTWTKAPQGLKRCDEAIAPVETAGTSASPNPTVAAAPPAVDAASPPAPRDEKIAKTSTSAVDRPVHHVSGTAVARSPGVRHARASEKSGRHREVVKLADLGDYGLQDVTLRKSRGGCSLKISDFGRVAFPC